MTPAAVAPSSMSTTTSSPPGRKRPFEPAVLGVLVFMGSELMFFSGLLSAYNIARARVPMSIWPPPDQPRLPIESTAANSVVLMLSGVLVWLAYRAFMQQKDALKLAVAGAVAGATFVAVQGYEWAQLLSQGLTMQKSAHASFFYMIVGVHAAHAIAGIFGLIYIVRRLAQRQAERGELRAAQLFWTFVVLVWPVIYVMVYL
jgi:cytochrome c oxidase subunit 3